MVIILIKIALCRKYNKFNNFKEWLSSGLLLKLNSNK